MQFIRLRGSKTSLETVSLKCAEAEISFLTLKTQKREIFKWGQCLVRERVLTQLLADVLNGSVVAEIKKRNPRYLRDDKFAWLNESVASVNGQPLENIPEIFGVRLSKYFGFVTAFHGSRPNSASDFLNHGLKLSDTATLQNRAVDLFGDSENLRNAILDLRGSYERSNNAGIWLCVTKEAFLQRHDHYLAEGSEYLSAIAGRIGQNVKLRAIGTPVIVECLVPNEFLDQEFWHSLSCDIIEDYFIKLLRPSAKRGVNTLCMRITQAIVPENILCIHEYSEHKRSHKWADPQTGAIQCAEDVIFRPLKRRIPTAYSTSTSK